MSDAISSLSSSADLSTTNARFQPSSTASQSTKNASTQTTNSNQTTAQTSTAAHVVSTESNTTKNSDGTYGPKHTLTSPDAVASSNEVDVNI